MKNNPVCHLFRIKYPIIQAGMVWCSGWRLASAVSNAGGLGLIGAGSMHPEILEEHIRKCRKATQLPFGVNVPLLYPEIDNIIEVIIREQVPIVFTSAGNPSLWTSTLKAAGITVVHVVSSTKFALKAEVSGVDAVVAEGFEAGGHNGREETTTFCLLPAVRNAVKIPVIAAGGIGDGSTMLAAMALGADGVQVGSRFAVTQESSAHENFKKAVVEAGEGATKLTMKKLTPVRLIKNDFYNKIFEAEQKGADPETLRAILGKKRAKLGIFEGDLQEGELEIGQISAMIRDIPFAKEVVDGIWTDFLVQKSGLCEG